jgi:hypothetical protein
LISSSSSSSLSRDIVDTENSIEEEEDEEPEIGVDEKRPLLSFRRRSSRSYSSSNRSGRTSANKYFNDLNKQEGFIEIDPGTGRPIPHDHVERTGENILLQTLERSHQVVAASMLTIDPQNPTPVPTQAFEAELKQKAKLVKLGIQLFLSFLIYLFYLINKVLCDVLHLKKVMMMTTRIMSQ